MFFKKVANSMLKRAKKRGQRTEHVGLDMFLLFMTAIIVIGSVLVEASAAERDKPQKVAKSNKLRYKQRRKPAVGFSVVAIPINKKLSLADISALPMAPGSNLEVLESPNRVKAQLPTRQVKVLVEQGAEITVLRNFVLFEGSAVSQ